MHFTETCDEELPRLITHVTTDIGPIADREALPAIHEALDQQDLLAIRSTLSMRETLMRNGWSPVKRSIEWIWWARPARIIAGKRENRLAMPDATSAWIGNTNKHAAHKDRPAAVGHPPQPEVKK